MPSIIRGDQTVTFITLSFLYAAMTAYTFMRLRRLHRVAGNALDTQKLFVVTLLLTSVLRTLSFVGLSSLSVQSIRYSEDDDGDDGENRVDEDQEFYEKSVLVMFDLPDYTIVTAYLLLVIVYAEVFLYSRRHWLDPRMMRRRWVSWYLGINTTLYGIQLCLYTLLFIPKVPQAFLFQLIYITLGTISFLLPMAVAVLYFYLTFKFSAFPFRSKVAAAKVSKVGFVMNVWTAGRFVWGVFALTSAMTKWAAAGSGFTAYTVVLLVLFICVEIIPFLLALDSEVLEVLALLSTDAREAEVAVSIESATRTSRLSGVNMDPSGSFQGSDLEEPLMGSGDGDEEQDVSYSIGLDDVLNGRSGEYKS